jgi:hypothetical protein
MLEMITGQFIIDQLLGYWQFVLVGLLILLGWVINMFGVDQDEPIVGLKYEEMPHMQPIKIDTAGKGFWGAVWLWFWSVRTWQISKDWHFEVHGQQYVIPAGFVFDGASVPKFLASWLSPTGVLLIGGLVHDFIYKYETLVLKGKKKCEPNFTQKEADELFRDICIEQNGFHVMNWAAYYALRLGGFVAWKGHRKAGSKVNLNS